MGSQKYYLENAMSFSLSDITKIIEIKTRYFFGAWVFGALLIFLPAEIKAQMGITIPEVVRPWLGFSTLAVFVLWLVLIVMQIFSVIRQWFKERGMRSEILVQLETLSDGERSIFILCLSNNQRTIQRNITDGSANSLKSKRLLAMATQGSILSMPFTIPNFVWEHIKSNEAELFPELTDENAMRKFHQSQQHGWMR